MLVLDDQVVDEALAEKRIAFVERDLLEEGQGSVPDLRQVRNTARGCRRAP